jgi:hypothetical protein
LFTIFDAQNNIHMPQNETPSQIVLTEKQLELVKEALADIKDNPERFSDWEEVQKTIFNR